MKIRSMHLENYRCFSNFDIHFDEQLTVLVGENGAGKTAVLDALSVFLRGIGIPNSLNPGKMLVADILIGSKPEDIAYHLELLPTGSIGEESKKIILEYATVHQRTIQLSVPASLASVKKMIDAVKPISVAYMAGRIVSEQDSVLVQNTYTPSTDAAFENSFSRTIDYASTVSWFNNADANEARDMRDSGQKKERPELVAVRKALSKALLGEYERPRMINDPPELGIYKKGTDNAFKVSQLSDGYRAMLALVMDLARRMAQAHGSDGKPGESLLHAPAIVLIDEVELHLHPSWQQTVLNTLMEIFPNTQFIVTTHSPQVLTAIPPKHIRVLSEGKVFAVDEQTQGAEASRLLKNIFRVELRPKNLEIVKALSDYRELVYGEKWNTPKAEELKKKLVEHFGNDELALMDLELHVENSKWESGL